MSRTITESGMSLRAYVATAALAGLLADHKDHSLERKSELRLGLTVYLETYPQAVARLAVAHADALLAELAK